MTQRVEVLAVGDELVHGQITDTNSAWLAARLGKCGVEVARFNVVSDAPAELEAVLREVCARADLVMMSGGLGPTEDDRTRDAVAAVVGEDLVFDEVAWRQIQSWFVEVGREPSPSNKRQASRPASAQLLENRWGTAPGFTIQVDRAKLFVFPGVPREMQNMVEEHLVPLLGGTGGVATAFARLLVVGPGESVLGERLAEFMHADREPRVGITAQGGLLNVRVAATGATESEAHASCARTVVELLPKIGDDFVCEGDADLEVHAVERLLARGATLATAESCTGGLLGAAVTDVAGASAVFRGGVVCYTGEAKQRDAGVPAATLEAHGEVSVEVAAALASGIASRTGARVGIGITGIAGPSGGSVAKPVGLVCFGLSIDGTVHAWERRFAALGRSFVRRRAVLEALAELIRACDRGDLDAAPQAP